MKDSKKYATKIKNLFKNLKKGSAPEKEPDYKDPIDAIVYAVISEHSSLSSAKSSIKKIKAHFVDYNDLRVSRPEEIIDVLEIDKETGMRIGDGLTRSLNAVFTRYDMVSLASCLEVGKRQARKELEDLKCLSDFVLSYCFLTALKGHSIPLTESMLTYLHDNELVYPSAKADAVEGFLERQISTADGYTFYILLRQESEKASKKVVKAKAAASRKKAVGKKRTATAKKKAVTKKKTVSKKAVTKKKKTVTKKTTTKKAVTRKRK